MRELTIEEVKEVSGGFSVPMPNERNQYLVPDEPFFNARLFLDQ